MVDMWKGFIHLLALVCLIYKGFCEPACPANQANNTIHVCRAESVISKSVYIDTDGSPLNYHGSCRCSMQTVNSSTKALPVTIESKPGPLNGGQWSMVFKIFGLEFYNHQNNSVSSAVNEYKEYMFFQRTRSTSESSMCLSIHDNNTNYGPAEAIRVVCEAISISPSDGSGTVRPNDSHQPSEDRTSESSVTSMSRTSEPIQSHTALTTKSTQTPTQLALTTKSTPTPTQLALTTKSTQTPTQLALTTKSTPTPTQLALTTKSTQTPTQLALTTKSTQTPTSAGTTKSIKKPTDRTSESSNHDSMDRTSKSTSDSTHTLMARTTESTNNSKSLVSDDTMLVIIVVGCVLGAVVATSLVIILCKRKSRRLKLSTTQQGNCEQTAPTSNYYTTENRNYVQAEMCTFSNQKPSAEERDVFQLEQGHSSTLQDSTYAEIGEPPQQDSCAYAQVCKGNKLKRATDTKDESHAINEGIAADSVYNITGDSSTISVTNTPNDNIYNTFVVEDDYNHLHEVVNPKITSNNIYGAASDVIHKA